MRQQLYASFVHSHPLEPNLLGLLDFSIDKLDRDITDLGRHSSCLGAPEGLRMKWVQQPDASDRETQSANDELISDIRSGASPVGVSSMKNAGDQISQHGSSAGPEQKNQPTSLDWDENAGAGVVLIWEIVLCNLT